MRTATIAFVIAASLSTSALAGGSSGVGAIDWKVRQTDSSLTENINELKLLTQEISFQTANSTPSQTIFNAQDDLERIENLLAFAELVDIAISRGLFVVPGGSFVYSFSKTVGLYSQAVFMQSPSVWDAAHSSALSTALGLVGASGGEMAVVAELIDAGIDGATARRAVDELFD